LNSEVEPHLAVDPRNSMHLVGVWQQDRFSNGGSRGTLAGVSIDGGDTWTNIPIPGVTTATGGPFPRASDPWVTIGPSGDVYVSSLVAQPGIGLGVYVSKSTDGGFTWGSPSVIIDDSQQLDASGHYEFFDDKESITADPINPNDVYVVWDRLNLVTNTSGPAMFSRTTNGGQSWSMPQNILDPVNGQTVGNQIVVLPNGILVNITVTVDNATNHMELVAMRSLDKGATWAAPVNIADDFSIIATDPNTGAGVRTGEELPAMAVDPRSGNIYVVWEDTRFSSGARDEVAFSMSNDGGLTWTAPIKINQTPNTVPPGDQQAFTPSVAVAASGQVAVSYYDFRNNVGGPGLLTDAWVVFADPAQSLTFGNEQRLTPTSFDMELAPFAGWGYFVGDYEGLVAAGPSFNTFAAMFGVSVSSTNPTDIVYRGIVPPSMYGLPIDVSGLTAWANTSETIGQSGTNYLNSEVEPRLAADPRNPSHLVAVWQQDRWSDGGSRGIMAGVSTDGGLSWTNVAIPGVSKVTGGPLPRASDPWVSIAPNGDVYVATLAAVSVFGPSETMYVSKSTDGGLSWGAPIVIKSDTDPNFFDDKESVTADPTNSQYVYYTFDRIDNAANNGPAWFSRSTDGGQTWETARIIAAPNNNTQTIGNQIIVLPDGTLLDEFDFYDFIANTTDIQVIRSTDHGVNWSAPIEVSSVWSMGVNDPDTGAGLRTGGDLPEIAVDRHSSALYIVWQDGRFSGGVHSDVALSMSTDGGLTWTGPIKVNQTPTTGPAGDQQAFTPTVAVADTGVIAVSYYDFRNNTSAPGLLTDHWIAFANPGATLTFGNEQRLTSNSFDSELAPNAFGYMVGDYMGLVAGGVSFNTFADLYEVTVSAQNPSSIVFQNVSAPDTFVVTNTTDNPASPAQGSLRWAIQQANAHAGADYIYFDIAPGGAQTIAPVAALPAITDSVTIDADSQPGFAGKPIIQVDGVNAGPNVTGLTITAANCLVRGMVIDGFSGDGIDILGAGASGNRIQGDYIGTDLTGQSAVPNSRGVLIASGANHNFIGTDGDGKGDAQEGNVISGNLHQGIDITGDGTDYNVVAGNYIGVAVDGTSALGNSAAGLGQGSGIRILTGPQHTRIGTNGDGTSDALERNIISAGGTLGINIIDASNNIVAGNYIGTDASGTQALGNAYAGIQILSSARVAQNNRIGINGLDADAAAEANVIAGNGFVGMAFDKANNTFAPGGYDGIFIASASSNFLSTNNIIAGNLIGTDANGNLARGNAEAGIYIQGASGTLITEANTICANAQSGITLDGATTTGTTALGSYIGTNSLSATGLGNSGPGVLIENGANNNSIGGPTLLSRNIISGNAGDGVSITGSGVTGNLVAANFIGTNVGGTAQLPNGGNGVTISGGASSNLIGTNGFFAASQNVISGNAQNGILITGTATKNTIAGNYIGINAGDTGTLGNGQNGIRIDGGAFSNTLGGSLAIDGNAIAGNAGFGILITGTGTNHNWVAANFIGTDSSGTAGLGNGNKGIGITQGASYNLIGVDVANGGTAAEHNVVAGNGGSGIYIADDGTNYNVVSGNYLGITPDGEHPLGNGRPFATGFISGDVFINAGAQYTQVGTSGKYGQVLDALERNIISGGNTSAYGVLILDASNNHVAGNWIGTDATGTQLLGNGYSGVAIISLSLVSQNNVIGVLSTDLNPADEVNLIVGNGFAGLASDQANPANAVENGNYAGVTVESQAANLISTGNVIAGNDIGTTAAGWGNAQAGIYVTGATGTLITGANVISGNAQSGITIDGAFPTTATTIAGNKISANTGAGVQIINGATGNTIGGSTAGTGNIIASNSGAGVEILGAASVGNQIRGNSIYANGGLGIDLGGDGVTANHVGAAVGPNNFQNFPVLNAARHGAITRVVGTLNGLANTTYTLDFYASASADPSGYGQGQRYLGSGQVTTDASGNATFDSNSFAVPLGASLKTEFITATATDPANNTSEFSAALLANAGPVAVNDSYLVQENSANNSLSVLANDYDQVGDSFTITGTGTPDHGTVSINGSNVLYTPMAGYFGPDSFNYTISDAYGDTSTATVSITVNAPPVAVNDSPLVQENIANNLLNVLSNDFDPDGDPLTITNTTTPNHGTASINGSNVLYTPMAGYFGPDSFNYTISDGQGGTSTATVNINVNAPPVAVNDSPTVQENSANNLLNVLSNDFDPDGDPLTITNTTTPNHGTASINGSNVLYTPMAGYFGPDSFNYTISDGQGSTSTATVNINVNAPPIAVNDSALVQQNSSNNSLAVQANDSDPDGDPLTITNTSTPIHGTASINGSNILYIPMAGYFGPDSFNYTISDGQGGTSTATVNITVNGTPVANNDAFTVQQNSANNSLAVQANDSDPDGDPLTITNTTAPNHGTVSINGSSILYTPTLYYYGPDSFNYTISDGQGGTSTATASITVSFRPVTISGTVFQDQNDNHIQDVGESGLAGWTVQLDGGAMSVITDASGGYSFTGVGPGTHTISEVVQTAYIETSPRGNAFSLNTSNGVDVSGKNFSNEIPTNVRDNSLNGYSESCTGWVTVNSGYLGTSRAHAADITGGSFARWQLNVGSTITPGKYEVFVTYVVGGASNAPYTVLDNKTVLATIAVDQSQSPTDGVYRGVRWRSLGAFTFNSGKPLVILNANANGVIDADGVLLIPASAYAPPPASPLVAAAQLSPPSGTSLNLPPTGKNSLAPVLVDSLFSNLSQGTSGLRLGGIASTGSTSNAVLDRVLADGSHSWEDLEAYLASLGTLSS
jgi:titin